MPLRVFIWPECPGGFDPNGLALVLITLTECTRRSDARLRARAVLREMTCIILSVEQIEIMEGPDGPMLAGTDIHISLSYAGDKVLLGLSCGRALGVDIMKVDHFTEIESLSRLYLPKAACLAVLETTPDHRDSKFAHSWTQMEACCKALGLPLVEIDRERALAYAACELFNCKQIDGYRISVAVSSTKHPD